MKKIAALTLALLFVLSFAACAGKTENPTNAPAPSDAPATETPSESVPAESESVSAAENGEDLPEVDGLKGLIESELFREMLAGDDELDAEFDVEGEDTLVITQKYAEDLTDEEIEEIRNSDELDDPENLASMEEAKGLIAMLAGVEDLKIKFRVVSKTGEVIYEKVF